VYPILFAGTCTIYSKKAIIQLTIAAIYHFLSKRFRRCAYQAKVIKTLETISSSVVLRITGMIKCPSSRKSPG
jgi:hypothetical protein